MFDNLQKQPDDIFAETDKSAPQVAPPTAPPAEIAELAPTEPRVHAFPETSSVSDSGSVRGGRLKAVIIFVAIVLVIGAAFLISLKILRSKTPVTPQAPVLEEESAAPVNTQPSTTPVEEAPAVIETQIDTDKDGLLDAREAELGTDISKSDTDGDTLFDREEVDVYKTNPLSPDTDGDGYLDGAEVKGGYNPNGPGKLLELPETK